MRRLPWSLGALLLTACVATSPVAPQTAPVEVLARVSAPVDERCGIHPDEVAAGVHLFLVVADGPEASVRVTAPGGDVVLESEVRAGRGASAQVDLSEGEYVVACVWSGGVSERAALTVVP